MRRTWLRILLAASLCLNGGFIAAVVVHRTWHASGRSQPDLKLAPATKAKLDQSEAAFWGKMGSLHDELFKERSEMLDVLASPAPTPEAVTAQQAKVLDVNARILQTVTEHVLSVKSILTPEEQGRFFEFIRRRNTEATHRPRHPNEERRQ